MTQIRRYKLVVEYDGTGFAGWQWQVHDVSVQQVLEAALERLLGERTRVYAAGRTDAGVHAIHQVVHFDAEAMLNLERLAPSLNFFMRPHPVVIVSAEAVPGDFHARFSAISRSYVYKILNRTNPSILLKNRAWHVQTPLDATAMQAAAQILVGTHDFTSFRSAHCQSASPIKTISKIQVIRVGELIEIHLTAPSFLHNQVRIITGALKKIGDGSWTEADIARLLAIKDRTQSAPTAQASGLYLCGVGYL
jgi:tRNA pseudouridine38-40 synthase